MTNERNNDGFQPFFIFSSPWEQVAVFFFFFLPPLVLSHPAVAVSFPFIPWFKTYLGGGGGGEYLEQNSVILEEY